MPLLSLGVLLAGVLAGGMALGREPEASSDSLPACTDSIRAPAQAVLYYFHRTSRCHTCLTIEAYIDEALRTHFARALGAGRLVWHPTNVEEPQNAHFAEDFALEFNSAILVRLEKDGTTPWVNLVEVWDLLGDKNAFIEYIRSSVSAALLQGTQVLEVRGDLSPDSAVSGSKSGPGRDAPR